MPTSNWNRAQLGALVWLKWRLFANALRSRRGAANRMASALGTLAALFVSLIVALGFGVGAYFLIAHRDAAPTSARVTYDPATGASVDALFVLFGMMSLLYLMWATVPLSFGGGSQFAPGRLLLYPISLRKLFLIDLVSELTSLAAIFVAPSIFALALGAGLARGSVVSALVIALGAILFGLTLAKLLATGISTLMQMKRARGEALLAFIGVVGAFSGLALGQGAHWMSRFDNFPAALRYTPPGAVAVALAGGAGAHYALSLLALLVYTLLAAVATYAIARRALRGGGKRRAAAQTDQRAAGAQAQGWQLPFCSQELSTVFEKELRYAWRNAQLRTMALMPILMTVSFKLIGMRRDEGRATLLPAAIAPYAEGSGAALSVLYAFLITSALSANLFGYEAGGMRAYVLAPVARRTILAGKNLALLLVTFVFALAVTLVNALAYRDLSWRAGAFTALCFIFFAAASAMVGNWFSILFPKRLQFGKRMNASGMAGLLLLPVFAVIAAPPVFAVLVGYAAKSLLVEYVILTLFAGAGVAVYFLLIGRQGRMLARRELDILEVVTGRDDD